MTEFSIQTNLGIQAVKGMSVVSYGGSLKPVIEAAVVDTDGVIKTFWPSAGNVYYLKATPYYYTGFTEIYASWTPIYMNVTSPSIDPPLTIKQQTTNTVIYTGAIPNTLYTVTVDGYDSYGNEITPEKTTVKTGLVPSTSYLTASVGTLSGGTYPVTFSFRPPTIQPGSGISLKYEITNKSTGVATVFTSSPYVINMAPNQQNVQFEIRTVYTLNGVDYKSGVSSLGGTTSVTTPATSIAPGTQEIFKPTANQTWSSVQQYRPTSDRLFHGYTNETYGTQTSVFFGYQDSLNRKFDDYYYSGVTSVKKVEIYVKRGTTSGSDTATTNRFVTHNHATKTTPPVFSNNVDQRNMSKGEAGWVTIYDASDPDLDGSTRALYGTVFSGTIKGFGWGNVSSRYMATDETATDNLALTTPTGAVRFTF